MKDRIRQIMESQNLTQQDFADKLGISPASLSSIFNNRTKPTLNHVDAIKISFPEINLAWLLYGEGSMYEGAPTPSVPSNSAESTLCTEGELPIDFSGGDDRGAAQYASPRHTASASGTPAASEGRGTSGAGMRDIQVVKNNNKPARQISEIRIFFDDQTWETFVPKKDK